jgi:multidrug resistance protein, MATE family
MLSNIGHIFMNVADTVMVGHVGANALAGAGLANVVFNVFLFFGLGVANAITPFVAEARGQKNDVAITATLKHGLIINCVNAVVLIGIVELGKGLLVHLRQPDEVIQQAIPYLDIIMFSLLPVLFYQSFKQFAEGMSNTVIALIVIIVCNVLNIILNYILIYGHFGFPAYGLVGAGYATLISRIFMAIAMASVIYWYPAFRKFREAFAIGNYSRKLISRMLHLGVPSGAQFIFEVAAFDFSLVMMGWLGPKAQAAHQIVINLATLSYMTTAGLAAASTVRIGHYLGRRDVPNMKRAAMTILAMGASLMFCFALVFLVAKDVIPALYIKDAEVITIAGGLMLMAALFQLSDGTQVICAASLRGLQDVKVPSIFVLIAYWVIGLPLGYYLTFVAGVGPLGIWAGLFAGLTITAILMFMRLQNQLRRQAISK